MPFSLIPFLLLIVPVVEIGVFIMIGGQIGLLPTLLMILVTAIIGTLLLRHQGFRILSTIRAETAQGRVPGRALGDGAMILVAGILLLTPGFVTDSLGFLLFVPGIRTAIWSFLATRIVAFTPGGAAFSRRDYPFGGHEAGRPASDDVTVIDLNEDEYSSDDPADRDIKTPPRHR